MIPVVKRSQYKLKCDICELKFRLNSDLSNHKRIHYDPKLRQYSCLKCINQFSSSEILEEHRKSCVGNRKKFACNYCGNSFTTGKQLDKHTRDVHKKAHMYKCHKCNSTFSWHENLIMHEKSHSILFVQNKESKEMDMDLHLNLHPGNLKMPKIKKETSFLCSLCNASFKYDFSYSAHMAGHNIHSQNTISPESLQDSSKNDTTSDNLLLNECDLMFGDSEVVEIDAHMLSEEMLSTNTSSSSNLLNIFLSQSL